MLSQLMWFGFPAYTVCIAAAAVLSLGLFVITARKAGFSHAGIALQGVLSAVLGYLGARVYFILAYNVVGNTGLDRLQFFSPWPFEYAMCGAVLGVMLSGLIGALATKKTFGCVMDAAAIPAMLMLVLARGAEVFSDFGWGKVLTTQTWQFFPFAVTDMFGQWHTAVFFLEALCALVVLVYAARMPAGGGMRFATALLWFAMTQIFCESLRVETIRWGFVRVQQVQCAVFGLAILLIYAVRQKKQWKETALRTAVYVAGVGVLVLVEYALDKLPWPNWLCYTLMASALAVMGLDVQGTMKEKQ